MQAFRFVVPAAFVALSNLAAPVQAAPVPPAPPRAKGLLVEDLASASVERVRAAWKPMAGSALVSVIELGGGKTLHMPCHFQGAQIERASWDRPVKLDLAACRGLRFDFYCADVSPVSYFAVYLHSGNGWYTTVFGPSAPNGWSPVVVDKTEVNIEGQPAGWDSIDTIRVSAWRGKNTDTEFYIANLSIDGADAPLAIVRTESAGRSRGQADGAAAKDFAQLLDRLGVPFAIMSGREINGERLKGRTVAVLTSAAPVPDESVDQIARFVSSGGKLLVLQSLPSKLAELIGIRVGERISAKYPGQFASVRAAERGVPGLPEFRVETARDIRRVIPVEGRSHVVANWFNHQGEAAGEPAIVASDRGVFVGHTLRGADPAAKRMLVSALLGHLDPSLWPKMVGHGLEQFGKLGPYPDREAAVREIAKQGEENPLAMAALREAQRGYHGAVQAFRERRFPEAMSSLVQSQSNLLRAHCGVQVPKAGEHRAWWCHSAFGVTGISWDEAIQRLADNGFNAILPNMLWGGVAFYDSRVLPVSPEVKEKGDQIAQCVAACRKYGVQCHVWKVNWNMGYAASAEFVERMTNEHRTQVSYDGKPEPRWLCPSHPANQKLEVDSMVEVATKYDVDGIHFDYIRYPGSDNCFCSGCRERFETACGVKPTHWPADPRNDAAIRQKWLDFRRDNITKVVAAVHESVKRQKPSVKISAAVFRNWPVDRDGVGQDWKLWCDRGYLDFVCPMDYITNNRQFEAVIGQQLQWAGKVPCYPGIGLSTWPGELDVVNLIEQIHTTRRMGTGGFTVFNYAVGESREIVPLCGQGITRRR